MYLIVFIFNLRSKSTKRNLKIKIIRKTIVKIINLKLFFVVVRNHLLRLENQVLIKYRTRSSLQQVDFLSLRNHFLFASKQKTIFHCYNFLITIIKLWGSKNSCGPLSLHSASSLLRFCIIHNMQVAIESNFFPISYAFR